MPTVGTVLLELKLTGSLATDYVANVLHLQAPIDAFTMEEVGVFTSINFLTLQTALQDLNDATGGFLGLYLACLPADYTARSMQLRGVAFDPDGAGAQKLSSLTAIIAGGDLDGTVGARTGEISAQNLSPGLVWITGVARRQGKMFLPGVSEDDISEGVLGDTLEAAMAAFGTLLTSGSLEMNSEPGVIAAVYDRGTPGPEYDGDWLPATASKIGNIIYQQGRRRVPW